MFVDDYSKENLQKIYKYPYYKHHKSLHDEFLKDFSGYKDKYE
jgi:hemerythrin